jgi:hypothetical protein
MRWPALALVGSLVVAGCLASPKDDIFAEKTWVPGDVEVEGVVASVETLRSGDQDFLRVEFEDSSGTGVAFLGADYPRCTTVMVPATEQVHVGQRYRTTLHFEATTFNGQPAIVAPELECPLGLLNTVSIVVEAVGWVSGCNLRPLRWDAMGVTFEVDAPTGRSQPASEVSARLATWRTEPRALDSAMAWADASAAIFVDVTRLTGGAGGPPGPFSAVEDLGPLVGGDGRLRHVDANGNGLLDDFDRLTLQLPPEPTGYQLYSLVLDPVGPPDESGQTECAGASWVLVNGPHGIVRWRLTGPDAPVALRLSPDEPRAAATVTWMSREGIAWGTRVEARCQPEAAPARVTSADGSPKPLDGTATVEVGDVVVGCPGATLRLMDRVQSGIIWQHDFERGST